MKLPKRDEHFKGDDYQKGHFNELMRHCVIRNLFIDIGAHVGWFCNYAAEAKFKNIIAFEPDEDNYDCLLENTKHLSNLQSFNIGLSREYQSVKKVIDCDNNTGAIHFEPDGDYMFCALDRIVAPVSSGAVMKIDVQGMEADVLVGASEFIERSKPIILIEMKHMQKRNTEAEYVLADFGYQKEQQIGKDEIWQSIS